MAVEVDQAFNIANLIVAPKEGMSDKVAITTPKELFTHGDLRHAIGCFALHMQSRGVSQSSCVAIDTNSTFLALVSTLATALLGCRWVQASRDALHNKALGLTHLLHDGAKALPHGPDVLEIDKDWLSRPHNIDESASITFEGYDSPEDTWMIARSSGTTGMAKFMPVSHKLFSRCIKKRTGNAQLYFGTTPPISVSLIHPLVKTSLVTIISVFQLKGMVVAGGNYEFWRSAKVNTVQGSPGQIVPALEGVPVPRHARIQSLRASGARCSPELIDRLFGYFDTVSVGYGSTEADNVCRRVLRRGERHDGRLGRLFDDVDLQIIGEKGEVLQPDEDGIVRVRTDTQVSGYLGDDSATLTAFRDGWFYPGDIGRLTENGELIISGRVTDVLNLGGGKVNALLIDSAIASCAAVSDAVCFAKPDELGIDELAAVISIPEGGDETTVAEIVRDICGKKLGLQAVPKYIYFSDRAPRNSKMKAIRHAALKMTKHLRAF